MTQAAIIALADGIVTAMNATAFSLPFTAERSYLPTYDLPDMGTLHVTVVPKQLEQKLETRNSTETDYSLDIAVQKKPSELNNSTLDPLVRLSEEIGDFLLFNRKVAGMTMLAPTVRILYLQEHLLKFNQFTSVITLTFRGWREA